MESAVEICCDDDAFDDMRTEVWMDDDAEKEEAGRSASYRQSPGL